MTLGERPDGGPLVLFDADREEFRQRGAGWVEHAERAVARVGELDRRLDDPLKGRREVEVGADRHDGAEQPAQAPRSGESSCFRHGERLGPQQ